MSDLREKVAEIIRKGAIYPVTSDELADAAIALVLEEAAKVAEKTFGEGYHVAATIRALGKP